MNNMYRYAYVLFLSLNRMLTKVPVGPVYVFDIFMLVLFLSNAKSAISLIIKFWPALLLLLFAICWLIFEVSTGDFTNLNIRRFAISIYMFIPILLLSSKMRIELSFISVITISSIMLIASLSAPLLGFESYLRVSLLSITTGLLILLVYYQYKGELLYKSVLLIYLTLLFLYFVSFPSVFLDGGIYRTPLFGLILAFIIVLSKYLVLFFMGKIKIKFNKIFAFWTALILSIAVLFLSSFGQKIVVELLGGLQGLTGLEMFADLKDLLGFDVDRGARGSSSGTANTRVEFWIEIVIHNVSNWNYFLFGNGHYLSFFEKLFPGETFVDLELLEPHNSIMGIFYRYGITGLILFIILVYKILRYVNIYTKQNNIKNVDFSLTLFIYAFFFISFEVALESPHGAFLFWSILLAPTIFSFKKKKNTKATYLGVT